MSPRRRRASCRRLLLLAAAPLLLCDPSLGASDAPPADATPGLSPALHIGEGTVARRQVVAVSRDVEVAGEALADVVALNGGVIVRGRVAGDVLALGGDVRLAGGSRVEGDVFALGGEVEAAPGAWIGGRTVSHPSLSRAWITLLEGPSLGLPASSPVVLGAKLALLCGWLALALVLFATSGREVVATAESVAGDPFRNFVVGLTAVLAMVLTALLLTSLAGGVLALPLLFLVVFVALLLKLWGMVAVFHAIGAWAGRRLLRLRLVPLNALTLGLLLLGVVKLLPWVGLWAWTAATFIGVGAALTTKLGRSEPWLQTA